MSVQATHRTRAYAMLCEAYGATGWTITAGRFHRGTGQTLEAAARDACERMVEVRFGVRRPVTGSGGSGSARHNPIDARGVFEQTLDVRIAYLRGESGDGMGPDPAEAEGEASGGAVLDAVEDRAETDADVVRSTLGWQPNWSGLTPTVIDCAPVDEDEMERLPDRVIRTVRFRLLTWGAIPAA